MTAGFSAAYATWNGQPYPSGSTLNPECSPTDPNCTVATSTSGSTVWSQTGNDISNTNSGKVNITGGLVVDSATISSSTLGTITNSTWDGTPVALAFGGTGATDATTARTNLGLAYATSSQLNYYPLVAWGDSLTAGNEDGTGVTYPNVLAGYLGRPVTNKGVGGQTSTQIGVRQGGVAVNATISGGQIPASGGVTITFPTGYEPVTTQGPSSITGTLAGVAGTISLSGGIYTFTRSAAGSAVNVSSAAFVPSNGTLNNGTVIIWAGRNNYTNPSQVESDIAAMVSSLGSNQHYLILSVTNGEYSSEYSGQTSYNTLISLDNYLASTYSGHYLDIRSYLIQQGLSDAGLTATASDTADIANDTVPTSLRTDNVHLNATGYRLIARQIANYITTNIDPINNSGVVTTSFLANAFSSAYSIGNSTQTAGYFSSLGIGTSTLSSTDLFDVNGNIALTNSTTRSIYLRGGNGASQINIDFPEVTSATPALRLFRNTNTTGNNSTSAAFQIFKADGSGSTQTNLSAFANSYINALTGNVGIGTTTPLSKLAVSGGLSIGADYNFGAPSNGLIVEGSTGLGTGSTAPITGTKLEIIGGTSTVLGYDTTTANSTLNFGKPPLLMLIGDGSVNNGPGIGMLQLNIGASSVGQSASELYLGATRGTTASSRVAVGNNDILGQIGFFGDDGTNVRTRGAIIQAAVNTSSQGTSTGVIPAQLSLATVSNAPIAFFTNSQQATGFSYPGLNASARMFITGAGNIGIGTTTPFSKLAVSGGLSIGADYGVAAPTNGLLVEGNVGIGTTNPTTALAIAGTASTTNLIISGITNGATQCLQVDASGNITGTGSICGSGGGGASPGGSTGALQYNNGGAFGGASGLTWDNTNSKMGVGSSTPWAVFSVQANNPSIPLFAVGSTSAASFFITNNGSVSIGVVPSGVVQKLEVSGSARVTGGYYGTFVSSGSGTGLISFVGGLGQTSNPGGQIDLVGAGAATNPGVIIFRTGTGSVSSPEVARFTNTGSLGIGTTTPGARVDIAGANNATVNLLALSSVAGAATTTEFYIQNNGNGWMAGTLTQASDQRLKTNVQTLEGSSTLAAIESLQPVSFNWVNSMHGDGLQIGFIAQDLQKVFPNLVSTSSPTALTPDGTLGVNYIGLIAPTIKALQELAHQVADMAQSITTQALTAATGNFNQVKTKELCVGDTCVTEAQLKMLLQQNGQNTTLAPAQQPVPQSDSNATSETSTSTPDESVSTTDSEAPSSDTHSVASDVPAASDYSASDETASDTSPVQ